MADPGTKAASRPQSGKPCGGYRGDIQGMRGLAVVLVVLFHAGAPFSGGFVGVDVFFVISGFVITLVLMREWWSSGRVRLGRFYLRRLKRLGPALALVLISTTTIAVFVLEPGSAARRVADTALGASFLTGNVVIGATTGGYFDLSSSSNPLLHTWSLGVEEQFYLVFPLAVIAALTLGLRWGFKGLAIVAVSGGTLLSFALSVVGSSGYTPEIFGGWFLLGFYSPVSRAWEFGVGALIALSSAYLRPARKAIAGWLVGIGLGLVILSAVFLDKTFQFPGPWALGPVVGTALMVIGGLTDNAGSRALASPLPRFLGDTSYSWYLWHWPIIVFVGAIWPHKTFLMWVAVPVSFGLAVASYYLVEKPIRGADLRSPRAVLGLIAGSVVLPAGIALAAGLFTRSVATELNLYNRADWPGMLEGCNRLPGEAESLEYPEFKAWAASCLWNEGSPGRPVYLIGDSNAVHFSEPVIDAAGELERPAFSVTLPGCLPFEELVTNESCERYTELVKVWLTNEVSAGTVIISTSDTYTYPGGLFVLESGRELGPDSAEKAATYGRLLNSLVMELQSAGHDTVIVKAVPSFTRPEPEWDPALCSGVEFASLRCTRDIPRALMDSLQEPQRLAIDRVAESTNSPIVDIRGRYCDRTSCSPLRGDVLAYVDATHLTSDEARELSAYFYEPLRALSAHP